MATYSGEHGSVLGPWGTREEIGTTTGTPAGAVVMDTPELLNGGQDFGVWLHHR